ncbi:MAG: NAD(P)H-hydrate epimerase [Planctomycetota bacterium]|nr:MAG: NAD(P)H-hydrate epimerase [Planctomycetota bacterium]
MEFLRATHLKPLPEEIWSVAQCVAFDRFLQTQTGLAPDLLMENAGGSLAESAISLCKKYTYERILILCGPGNNGGDGLVAARQLLGQIPSVDIVAPLGLPTKPGPARSAWKALQAMGVELAPGSLESLLQSPGLVVDALFGVGLAREITGPAADWVEALNRSPLPVLAADLPSGLCGDRGQVLGSAVQADYTLSFVAYKSGFFLDAGPSHCGRLAVADIGVSAAWARNWARRHCDRP